MAFIGRFDKMRRTIKQSHANRQARISPTSSRNKDIGFA
jgi:hypothetical protein